MIDDLYSGRILTLAANIPHLGRLPAPQASVEAMLEALSDAWAKRFAIWSQPGGFGPTRAAWLERAAFLGETITIRLPEGPLSGRFAGIDPTGRLELDAEAGRRLIDAGDLFFGAA